MGEPVAGGTGPAAGRPPGTKELEHGVDAHPAQVVGALRAVSPPADPRRRSELRVLGRAQLLGQFLVPLLPFRRNDVEQEREMVLGPAPAAGFVELAEAGSFAAA